MDFSKTSVAGNGNLLIEGMQSPNFSVLTGTGWQINKDGSATFYSISLPNFPGSGTKVTFSATAPPSPNVGDVWYDTAAGLLAQQWDGSDWVPYSISAGALASGDTVNPNPYFAGGDTSNWTPAGAAVLAAVATSGFQYPFAGQVTAPAGSSFPFVNGLRFPVNEGDPSQVNGWINSNCNAALQVSYWKSDGSFLTDSEVDVNTGSAWEYVAVVGIVPTGAVAASLSFGINEATTTGSEVVQATGLTVNTKINGGLIETGTLTTLLYDGTPALGNLIASFADADTTDQFGNDVFGPGLTVYGSGGGDIQIFPAAVPQVQLWPAGVTIADQPPALFAAIAGAGTAAERYGVNVVSGYPTAGASYQSSMFAQGAAGDGSADGFVNFVVAKRDGTLWGFDLAPGGVTSQMPLNATQPGLGIVTETWHSMSLSNGWSVGSGGVARYKLMPDNTVMVHISDLVPGTISDNTTIWTPPTGYAPSNAATQNFPVQINYTTAPAFGSNPFVAFRNSGGMTCQNFRGTISNFGVVARYALD